MHSSVHRNIIYSSQNTEANYQQMNRQRNCGMYVCTYIHTHTEILLSHKKEEILLFTTTWTDLEDSKQIK